MNNRKKITVLRTKIDEIDHEILDLYQQRLETVVEIASLKVEASMEAEQPVRLAEIKKERAQYIEGTQIDPSTLERLITLFHDDAVAIQKAILQNKT